MKCLICHFENDHSDQPCVVCKTHPDDAEDYFRDTYVGAMTELADAVVNLLKAINQVLEPLIRILSIGGKMQTQEPKRISVSQVERYKKDGWTVTEYSECGRYAYVVKQ